MGPPPPPQGATTFRAEDFAWSQGTGPGGIAGHLSYAQGPVRYTCANSSVILTPETPWTRRRMSILYASAERAALPVDQVRARTPASSEGDYSAYVRRTVCDANNRFGFTGLPNGGWFVITIAKPVSGAGPSIALMRRVVTSRGRIATAEL
jgi:hypothetical protein